MKIWLNLYYNWLYHALLGQTKISDSIYQDNRMAIETIAKSMRKYCETKTEVLYRGVLLEDEYVNNHVLLPLPHIQTLSFSTTYESALVFASTTDDMAISVMKARPTSKGYMIAYTPKEQEILYHHSWVNMLRIGHLFSDIDMELLKSQREVILTNTGRVFKLKELI